MIESALRERYQDICVNRVALFLRDKTSPNQITVLSGLLGILVLPALYFNQTLFAITLLLLSGYCDTLDGTLARLIGKTSDWGTLLDIVVDRLVEFTVVFALFTVAPETRGALCLLMLGSMLLCVTSFLVVGIFTDNQTNKSFHYSVGLMERAEAFLFFIAMMLLPKAFGVLALLFVLLVSYTAIFRMYEFYRK